MNLPNKLTVMRVILIIPFVVLMEAFGNTPLRFLALILFIAASITDALDGYIARRDHLVTNFGKFLDPLADKMLVGAALVCLVELHRIPAWAVTIIFCREFAISAFRLIASDAGIVIAASMWGKAKTVSQMVMVILLIMHLKSGLFRALEVIAITAAVILTVISLADYIYKNRQVLKSKE